MGKGISNNPTPKTLMNSMRSIGYSFKTALADIIDNSISARAKNISVFLPINDEELFIGILDDGIGMSKSELFNAMKYGSDREYDEFDLGRFGLGLKSASLSQCRVLTVISKLKNEINAYKWDLDYVIQKNSWDCIELSDEEMSTLPLFKELLKIDTGTLVLWENFDIYYKKSNGRIREYLSDEMYYAEKHLALVFHRFLTNPFKKVNIFINNDRIVPLDPFLENHPKTDTKKASELIIDGQTIKVQPYILPHQNDLEQSDIEKVGGIDSLRNGQGFYIYRNDRLIIYGTWFRLGSSSISSELMKYGRIKVDIPNTLDDVWEIDIKKQNATIPKQILNNLKKSVTDVCSRSKDKTTKRIKLSLEKDDTKIWNKTLNQNGKEVYSINEDCVFIKTFLDDFDDKDRGKILNLIEVIASKIPYDDIYVTVCNKNNETDIDNEILGTIVFEGYKHFQQLKKVLQKCDDDILESMSKIEPFNNDNVMSKIKEMIKNGK